MIMKSLKIFQEDMQDIRSRRVDYSKLKNKTILVTGAAGFLASYIIDFLIYLNDVEVANIRILGLVRNLNKATNRFSNAVQKNKLQLIQHDISNPFHTEAEIHFIIHAASNASPKHYGVDPVGTAKSNSIGTYWLLELARMKQVEGFLFVSSGEVYGQISDDKVPTLETDFGFIDPTDVRSCYAESKRLGENLCSCYSFQYGIPAKIVRPFHTYGPGMSLDDGRVFADFVANIINNQDIQMKSDGSARRAYCYITDAVAGFLLILLEGESGKAYNLGNPNQECSVLELANRLVALFPLKKLKVHRLIRNQNSSYLNSYISRNSPQIEKLKSLGWEAKHTIETGFKRTVESYSQ